MPTEELRVELLGSREVRDGYFDGKEATDGGLVCLLVGVMLSIWVRGGRLTGAVMIACDSVTV